MRTGVVVVNARSIDLADWIIAVWRKRGIIADSREDVVRWLESQDIARLERLKASGKPVFTRTKTAAANSEENAA